MRQVGLGRLVLNILFAFSAGKWTVQQAAELSVAAPTIEASLDGRFLSGLKDERVKAEAFFSGLGVSSPVTPEVRIYRGLCQDLKGFLGGFPSVMLGAFDLGGEGVEVEAALQAFWRAGDFVLCISNMFLTIAQSSSGFKVSSVLLKARLARAFPPPVFLAVYLELGFALCRAWTRPSWLTRCARRCMQPRSAPMPRA